VLASQARRRGFESLHPLHFQKDVSSAYKYASSIRGFLEWYGEELDLKVKIPHQMPEYVEDDNIEKLIAAIKNKQTHKQDVDRDILLIKLAYNSGLRREELANLKVSDILIHESSLMVRKGKGMKDRTVPLPSGIVGLLQAFIAGMSPDDSVFNLKPGSISDKIRRIAIRAGVDIHAHSLRHGYATRLLEKGANIKAVQELLGHSRIGTTEAYLALLPKHLREAVDLLDDHVVLLNQEAPSITPELVAEVPRETARLPGGQTAVGESDLHG